MPPRFFSTAADVDDAIQLGTTTESIYLDFKAAINGFGSSRDEKETRQKELCRDVTQFANHLGGCLLVGFSESKNQDGLKVASEFQSVQEPDKLREWIENAITQYCTPHTFTHHIEVIPYRGGILLAINVPASRIPVILWDRQKHTMEAVGRNNHGKIYLNPSELENLRMNGSRAAKIAFDASLPTQSEKKVNLVPGLLQWNQSNQNWFPIAIENNHPHTGIYNITDYSFEIRVSSNSSADYQSITIPYGLVQECWKDTGGQMWMLLQLDIGLYRNSVTLVRR
jgi:hypothetical protein